jgi:hypothetical protein
VLARFRTVSDVWLAARALAWACVLPVLKHLLPIPSLAALMRHPPRRAYRDVRLEEQIVTFARWGARLVRWRAGGNCLERGLIAYRYLGLAGAHPTLVVGVGKSETGVIGHAWVLVDGQPVTESLATLVLYTPMFAFAPDGSLAVTNPSMPTRGAKGVQLKASRA